MKKAEKCKKEKEKANSLLSVEELVIAEIVADMEKLTKLEGIAPVFTLSVLCKQ